VHWHARRRFRARSNNNRFTRARGTRQTSIVVHTNRIIAPTRLVRDRIAGIIAVGFEEFVGFRVHDVVAPAVKRVCGS
jgi:hypothetical protein